MARHRRGVRPDQALRLEAMMRAFLLKNLPTFQKIFDDLAAPRVPTSLDRALARPPVTLDLTIGGRKTLLFDRASGYFPSAVLEMTAASLMDAVDHDDATAVVLDISRNGHRLTLHGAVQAGA